MTVLLSALGCNAVIDSDDRDPEFLLNHRGRMLNLDSGATEVVEWGTGGPFLVLVHGASMTPHMFDQFAERLSDQYRVVAYARRGHGRATALTQPFDIDDLTDDLRAVMDSLGIQRAVLMGHSFGGNEITHFAAEYPDRVDGLVYLDADFGGPGNDRVTDILALAPLPPCVQHSTASLSSYRQCIAEYIMPPNEWSASLEELIVDGLADTTGPVVYRTAAEYMGESLKAVNTGYRREYDRITAPALFLLSNTYFSVQTGDTAWNRRFQEWHDTSGFAEARDENAGRIRGLMPGARVTVLPGTSHDNFVFFDETVAEVSRFLGTIS